MYQKLTIVGHLGKDPEMRYTPSGQAVTNLNVATSRRWNDNDGQQQEETIWFRVSAWGKLAETCNQYLTKGRQVLVEGRLTLDKESGGPHAWIDQNGKARASFEMSAFEVKFLGSAPDRSGVSDNLAGQEEPGLSEDEIPF